MQRKGERLYFGMAGIILWEIFPLSWIFFPKVVLATQNLKKRDVSL